MIREATLQDIPVLLEMGERFSKVANLAEHVGYDAANMAATFRVMIEAPEHVIFIKDGGAIGAMSGPHPFNYAHTVAQELFWWCENGGGLKLLRKLEEWAKERGASLRMACLEAVEPKRTGQLFERLGYAPIEHGYIKVF